MDYEIYHIVYDMKFQGAKDTYQEAAVSSDSEKRALELLRGKLEKILGQAGQSSIKHLELKLRLVTNTEIRTDKEDVIIPREASVTERDMARSSIDFP